VASFLRVVISALAIPLVRGVLISFREWLHSYLNYAAKRIADCIDGSHLFQRVASFLLYDKLTEELKNKYNVLISFREWLHSYN